MRYRNGLVVRLDRLPLGDVLVHGPVVATGTAARQHHRGHQLCEGDLTQTPTTVRPTEQVLVPDSHGLVETRAETPVSTNP